MSAARHRARRGEGERLRDEILDATESLLATTGDEDAVSIRGIAEAVGCTPPAIYMHFSDKEHLILAVCERHFAALDAAVEQAGMGVDDPVEALWRRGHAYVEFGIANPESYRIIFMGRPTDVPEFRLDSQGAGTVAFRHLIEAVQRCIDAGQCSVEDPILVATELWAAVHGVTSLAISTPGFPPQGLDSLVDHLLDVLCNGLGLTRASRP